jgi:hypothetical protein
VDIGRLIKVVVGRVVVELQLLGSRPWQMIPLFVIVGMAKGGTTCPTYEHHHEQNKKSANENSSVGKNLAPTYPCLCLLGVVVKSPAALSVTIDQRQSLFHLFNGKD